MLIYSINIKFNSLVLIIKKPMIMSLACIDYRLTMNEALIASTINSAFALGVEDKRGSIELGKKADFLIIKSNRYRFFTYII